MNRNTSKNQDKKQGTGNVEYPLSYGKGNLVIYYLFNRPYGKGEKVDPLHLFFPLNVKDYIKNPTKTVQPTSISAKTNEKLENQLNFSISVFWYNSVQTSKRNDLFAYGYVNHPKNAILIFHFHKRVYINLINEFFLKFLLHEEEPAHNLIY